LGDFSGGSASGGMALAGAHLRLLREPGGVTTGAGGCGALRSGAPNIAVSCVWPSSIVAWREGVE